MTEELENVPGDAGSAEAAQPKPEDTAAPEDNGDDTAAEGAEDEGEGEGEEAPAQRPKAKGGFQKRIAELTANWRSTERDRDHWRELALRNQQAGQPQKPQTDNQPPRQEDFQDYTAYLDARAEWVAEKKLSERLHQERETTKRQQAEARQRQAVQTYETRLDQARSKYEDFDDVAFAPDVHVTEAMAQAILDSEQGPELQYYLGSNPDEAQRIARMSPYGQVRALGALEAKLSAPKPPKKPTSAPPPVQPVAGRGASPTKGDPDKLPVDEWMRLEREGKLKYR